MEINKYNLLINQNFDKYTFSNKTDNGIFDVMTDNMTFNSLYLILSTKPTNTTDSATIALNATVQIYLFPTSITNVSFSVGEMIQTVDNEAIFIITNYINDNLFALKLVWSANGTNYILYNNTQSLIYNSELEKKWFYLNTNKTAVMDQWDAYTSLLDSNNLLGIYLSDKLDFTTDYTGNYSISFTFDIDEKYELIRNIIDKFYLNV